MTERILDMFAAVHPTAGIWNPSIRTTEQGSRNTFSDWGGHEIAGWKILPVRVTYLETANDHDR
jgi:hypothetical protein